VVLQGLTDLVEGSPLGYVVIAVLAFADAIFPAIPGEAALFTGAILAADGAMALPLVGAAAMVGGFLGDCTAFWLGRRLGPALLRRLVRSRRLRERIDWATGQLERRGEGIILVARFIPSGRTAVSFAAGSVGFAWRRFWPADLLAASAWALYGSIAGYLGGVAFRDQLLLPLALATVLAAVLGLLAEGVRRTRLGD
jgi:membrane protein DedA with SNARE-associated domain